MREEEKVRTSPKSNLQKFFRKRWVFPAIYLVSAAIILTGVLWFQSSNNDIADSDDYDYSESDVLNPDTAAGDEPSVVVNSPAGNFEMPVVDEDAIEIQRQFYDADASAEEQEAALVFYDNTYFENKGIDIVAKDGKEFEVASSLGGTVIKSEKDSLLGNVVEIEHAEGIVTIYQSLADVQVELGDQVEQGQVIAKAGKNQFNEEAAIHVHFEIRNNGTALNPIEFFGKPLTSLEEIDGATKEEPAKEEDAASDEEESPADKEKAEDEEEEAPADEEKSEDEDTNSTPQPTDASIGMARV
jgi:stage II sporulation protein Q